MVSPPFRSFGLDGREWLAAARRSLTASVQKGRRRKPSQGKCSFPCSRQRRQARNTAGLCGEFSPRQSAQRLSGCISAPLLPRVYSACRFHCSFFQKLPRRFACEDKPEKDFRFLVAHVDQLRRDTLHIPAPRTQAVVALLALLNDKPAVKHLASVLILPDFLLREFQLGVAFLNGLRRFLLRHGRSFLPVGTKKGSRFKSEIAALG